MAFRVELTTQAERDMDAIVEWLLAHQAGEAGLRWFRGLQEALQSLSFLPFRCPLAPEDAEFSFNVRQLVYGRKPHFYRILFTVGETTVTVLHVRHGRRSSISSS